MSDPLKSAVAKVLTDADHAILQSEQSSGEAVASSNEFVAVPRESIEALREAYENDE